MQEKCAVGTLKQFYFEDYVTLEIRVPRRDFQQNLTQCYGKEIMLQLRSPGTGSATDVVRIFIQKCRSYREQLAKDFLIRRGA